MKKNRAHGPIFFISKMAYFKPSFLRISFGRASL